MLVWVGRSVLVCAKTSQRKKSMNQKEEEEQMQVGCKKWRKWRFFFLIAQSESRKKAKNFFLIGWIWKSIDFQKRWRDRCRHRFYWWIGREREKRGYVFDDDDLEMKTQDVNEMRRFNWSMPWDESDGEVGEREEAAAAAGSQKKSVRRMSSRRGEWERRRTFPRKGETKNGSTHAKGRSTKEGQRRSRTFSRIIWIDFLVSPAVAHSPNISSSSAALVFSTPCVVFTFEIEWRQIRISNSCPGRGVDSAEFDWIQIDRQSAENFLVKPLKTFSKQGKKCRPTEWRIAHRTKKATHSSVCTCLFNPWTSDLNSFRPQRDQCWRRFWKNRSTAARSCVPMQQQSRPRDGLRPTKKVQNLVMFRKVFQVN